MRILQLFLLGLVTRSVTSEQNFGPLTTTLPIGFRYKRSVHRLLLSWSLSRRLYDRKALYHWRWDTRFVLPNRILRGRVLYTVREEVVWKPDGASASHSLGDRVGVLPRQLNVRISIIGSSHAVCDGYSYFDGASLTWWRRQCLLLPSRWRVAKAVRHRRRMTGWVSERQLVPFLV